MEKMLSTTTLLRKGLDRPDLCGKLAEDRHGSAEAAVIVCRDYKLEHCLIC